MNFPFSKPLSLIVLSSLFFVVLLATNSYSQVPPWLVDINQEIDMLEDNAIDCRRFIRDTQDEIDALLKNTPPPIEGTPAEDKLRQLKSSRFAAQCFLKKTEKDLKRLRVIRDALKNGFSGASGDGHLQGEINKSQQKVDNVEKIIKNNERAKKKAIDTVNNALGEHK